MLQNLLSNLMVSYFWTLKLGFLESNFLKEMIICSKDEKVESSDGENLNVFLKAIMIILIFM